METPLQTDPALPARPPLTSPAPITQVPIGPDGANGNPRVEAAGRSVNGNGDREGGARERTDSVDALVRKHPTWLVAAGLLVFLINIALAWHVTFTANAQFGRSLLARDGPQESGIAQALALAPTASPNMMFILHRVIEADVYHRLIANKQMLLTVGMAMSFGLMAIGFALFVLGIRSAFAFSGEAGPTAKVALTSASPGLLCFLLAAIVGAIALTREANMKLGDYHVMGGGSAAVSAPKAPPAPINKLQSRQNTPALPASDKK